MKTAVGVLEPKSICVLGVDPGRVKTGIAVVDSTLFVLWKGVVESDKIGPQILLLHNEFLPVTIVIGDGTGTKKCHDLIMSLEIDCNIQTVPESHTSEEARRRVIAAENPNGLRRFIPRSLRFPLKAYDDEVAVILAERKIIEVRMHKRLED